MKKILFFIAAAIVTSGLFAQTINDGLILYMSFDGETIHKNYASLVDPNYDYTSEDVALVKENNLEGVDGKFYGAAKFDSASYIMYNSPFDWDHSMNWTLSVWVKIAYDSLTCAGGIVGFSAHTEMGKDFLFEENDQSTDDKPLTDDPSRLGSFISSYWGWGEFNAFSPGMDQWEDMNMDAIGDEHAGNGEWHMLTYVHDIDTTLQLYLDGVNVTLAKEIDPEDEADPEYVYPWLSFKYFSESWGKADHPSATLSDDLIRLGYVSDFWASNEQDGPNYYEGLMDDYRLYDRALSADQVEELYESPIGETTSVENLFASNVVTIYPNPTSDVINILNVGDEFEVSVYNSLGQVVKSVKNQNQIDVQDLNQGYYFVQVLEEGNKSMSKILVK